MTIKNTLDLLYYIDHRCDNLQMLKEADKMLTQHKKSAMTNILQQPSFTESEALRQTMKRWQYFREGVTE